MLITHNDLKPDNIMVYDGKIMLIDFDICQNYLNK